MEVIERTDEAVRKAIKFVSALQLAAPGEVPAKSDRISAEAKPAANRVTATADVASGYVDAGSLVAFVAGVSALHQSDVLDSTLLAQLAASFKFDRETEIEDWFDFYRTVLENVGWVIRDFEFTNYQPTAASFTAETVIAEALAAIATEDDIKVVTETIAALNALPSDDSRVIVWDSNSSSGNRGNFQIGAASEADGMVAMNLCAFVFETATTVTNALSFTFSSADTQFYKTGQAVVLDEDIYGQVRAAVIERLGQATQYLALDLDIPE